LDGVSLEDGLFEALKTTGTTTQLHVPP